MLPMDEAIAWLKGRLVRPETGQASEVRVDIPRVGRFRIFRNPADKREWLTYLHRETPQRELEGKSERIRDLFKYEMKGDIENRTETRDRALVWLAIHWDREIARAMQEETPT